jgi:hypothetical protein
MRNERVPTSHLLVIFGTSHNAKASPIALTESMPPERVTAPPWMPRPVAAVFFSNYAAEVTMLVRGIGLALSMSRYLITQIAEKDNIRIDVFTEVTAVQGEEHLEQIVTTWEAFRVLPSGNDLICLLVPESLFRHYLIHA